MKVSDMNMYDFRPMTIEYATIIEKWRYNGFLKDIYMKPYIDNFNNNLPLKGPGNCDGYAVFKGNVLVGLFEYYFKENGYVEIGLALAPDFIGKKLSKDFIKSGINYLIRKYDYKKDLIFITVDKRNEEAFRAYSSFGFQVIYSVDQEIFMQFSIKTC